MEYHSCVHVSLGLCIANTFPTASCILLHIILLYVADDWKADQYRWIEYGRKCLPPKNPVIKRIYYYNVGPSGTNTKFRRLANVLLNYPNAGTMNRYIGDDTKAVQFPHGNRKKDNKSHYRTCPLVVKRLRQTNDTPSNVYKHEVSAKFPSHLQPVCLPRNVKQI